MVGIRVTFDNGHGEKIDGTIFRGPWGRNDNVSIRTDDGRIYVRLADTIRTVNS